METGIEMGHQRLLAGLLTSDELARVPLIQVLSEVRRESAAGVRPRRWLHEQEIDPRDAALREISRRIIAAGLNGDGRTIPELFRVGREIAKSFEPYHGGGNG